MGKDAAGKSKEGSGRVSCYRTSNMPHCYTLECNYFKGNKTNVLFPVKGEPFNTNKEEQETID